eukprot:EG_transcript_4336
MGKRKWQRGGGRGAAEEAKKARGDPESEPAAPEGKGNTWKEPSYCNALLEQFYATNVAVVPADEYGEFLAACRRPLPAAFRISEQRSDVKDYLIRQIQTVWIDRLTELAALQTTDGADEDAALSEVIVPPKSMGWYPSAGVAWTVTMPRHVLRRSAALKGFNRMLVAEHMLGGLARQEEVSMIPPTLLDIRPDSLVLDMCAAPGSKTIQLLEMLVASARQAQAPVTGCVVANDVSFKRAEVLVTQTQKLTELLAHLVIVNHDARNFPRLETEDGHHWGFDRILCDVMCSGDGTLRKSPDKWDSWTPRESASLHRMQIQVLQRAMYLCNVGGRIVYSTCSMNPVEDEAVLIECLTKGGGCFQLVDTSAALPGLQRRPGVLQWSVMTKAGQLCPAWEELPDNERSVILRSCFPPALDTEDQRAAVAALHIERAMRVLPHLQDTGGFFLAVLQKTAHWNPELQGAGEGRRSATTGQSREPAAVKSDATATTAAAGTVDSERTVAAGSESTARKGKESKKLTDNFIPISDAIIEQLRTQIQLTDSFPMACVHRRERNVGAYKKKLFWLSETASRVLRCMNRRGKFEVVNAGLRVFEELTIKGKADHWRLAHEGLSVVRPHLPAYRTLPVARGDAVALIRSKEGKLPVVDLQPDTQAAIVRLLEQGGGPCVLQCDDASPALSTGLQLSGYCGGAMLMLYLNKVDSGNVLYRMGVTEEPTTDGPTEGNDVTEVAEVDPKVDDA